jgi:hypothetical protein
MWGEEIVKAKDNSSALALKETRAVSPIGNRPERDVVETNVVEMNGGDERPATP